MLKNIKRHVCKLMYKYHYHMANYCYRKVDTYGPEDNDYWEGKLVKHVHKELEMLRKLV